MLSNLYILKFIGIYSKDTIKTANNFLHYLLQISDAYVNCLLQNIIEQYQHVTKGSYLKVIKFVHIQYQDKRFINYRQTYSAGNFYFMAMVQHMTLLQTFVSNTYYRGKQFVNFWFGFYCIQFIAKYKMVGDNINFKPNDYTSVTNTAIYSFFYL